jgi:hypothetical protein
MEFDSIFIIIWAVIMISILGAFYLKGKKALKIFPDINTVIVKYRDHYYGPNNYKDGIKLHRMNIKS